MNRSNPQPANLVTIAINLSFIYIFCLFIMNGLNARAIQIRPQSESNTISNLRQKVKKIYTSQIGIREKQSNSGPAVEAYLRYVNLAKGNPWCAAFVCWVYGKAGVVNPRTGWSPDLFGEDKVIWDRAESGKLRTESFHRFAYPPIQSSGLPLQTSSRFPALITRPTQTSGFRPQTSDVFALYFPEKGRIAHVGFIDKWDGTWMVTVEGNTNVSGSREGDGVYRKRRLVKSVYKVARFILDSGAKSGENRKTTFKQY